MSRPDVGCQVGLAGVSGVGTKLANMGFDVVVYIHVVLKPILPHESFDGHTYGTDPQSNFSSR